MTYDIYFHNDFDGMASAAVMLDFLESRGDKIGNYIPLTYNYDTAAKWPKLISRLPEKNPAIVLDFRYHPQAAFWFDHHPTAFLKKEWQRKFKPDKFHQWDIHSDSACGLVLRRLVRNFNYRPPKHLKDLAKWLNIIDMANFRSARQAIEKKEPALQLEELIDYKNGDKNFTIWMIKTLSQKPLKKIIKEKRIRRTLALLKSKRKEVLKFYQKNLKIYNYRLAFIDLSQSNIEKLRFAHFYLFPKVLYGLSLEKNRRGGYHLSFGVNPWRRNENKVHIGEFLKKYGGGGHKVVGGLEVKAKEKAEQIVNEIINKFS